ncbi:MAG: putative metal-dependent hydrolase [Acidobacteria bacterium]|nr:putative metal-dependent hydrolase [Acidobacteriota bacterium]
MNEDLRYPVGKLQEEGPLGAARRLELIEQIAETPERLRAAVHGLSHQQLDTPYRPGGWTVRQVIHHVPDSHLNAYVRFKLALTEETPTVKLYAEALWAALPDTGRTAPEVSLTLLDALHKRWVILLRALDDEGFARTLQHPEKGLLTLDQMLALYAWHGRHHVAHVTSLREREGWG